MAERNTGIDGSQIKNLSIEPVDLKRTGDAPTDAQILSYDLATGYFEWVSAGAGDMLKSTYDINEDGIVDKAEKLEIGDTKVEIIGESGDGYIKFTEDNSEIMRITGGNVGIGVTDPDEKLEITGNLKLSGNITDGTNASSPADIKDAVDKKHTANADTDLDSTFEATFVKKTDTVNVLSDITSAGADIEDAVTKKHTQNTDTQLDSGVLEIDGSDDLILTQNSVVAFKSINTGAVVNTLYLKEGNVGIGTNDPEQFLHLKSSTSDKPVFEIENTNEDAKSGSLMFVKDSASPANDDNLGAIDFYGRDSNEVLDRFLRILVEATNVTSESETAKLTINSDGIDVDVQIKGLADDNLLYIDAGNDNVGIGEPAPQDKLEVNGKILVKDKLCFTQDDRLEYIDSLADGYLDIEATIGIRLRINTTEQINLVDGKLAPTTDDDIDLGDSTHEFKDLYIDGTANIDSLVADSAVFNEAGADLDFRVEGVGQVNALFVQGSNGRVGIGIATPLSPLHIKGTSSISPSWFSYPQLYLEDSGHDYPGIMFAGTSGLHCGIRVNNGDGFGFFTFNSTTGAIASQPLTILENGTVGIGTGSPSAYADLTLEGGVLCVKETTTPTANANYGKFYTKNDNKAYFQDGAGVEHELAYA